MAGIVIGVRKCSEPGEQLKNIQFILLMNPKPFTKRKSVVQKLELKKMKRSVYWLFSTNLAAMRAKSMV